MFHSTRISESRAYAKDIFLIRTINRQREGERSVFVFFNATHSYNHTKSLFLQRTYKATEVSCERQLTGEKSSWVAFFNWITLFKKLSIERRN